MPWITHEVGPANKYVTEETFTIVSVQKDPYDDRGGALVTAESDGNDDAIPTTITWAYLGSRTNDKVGDKLTVYFK